VLEKEQYYLNKINPSLNTCKVADSPLGVKRDTSFGLNLSKAKRGKKHKVNMLKVITKSNTITSETRLNLSSGSVGIKVKIYDKSNNLVNVFPTLTSAAKHLNISSTTIRNILKTGISYDNYTYKLEEGLKHLVTIVNKEKGTVKEYYSIRSAAKDIGVSYSTVLSYINTNKLLKNIYLITKKLKK
jgi:hypothetical protein